MTTRFEIAALTTREPKSRDGRRCASSQVRRGSAEIGARAARSLPKSDSPRGPRFPGTDERAREVTLRDRELLVLRGVAGGRLQTGRRPRLRSGQKFQDHVIGVVEPRSPTAVSSLENFVTNLNDEEGLTGA
jgi:hypothetical protein